MFFIAFTAYQAYTCSSTTFLVILCPLRRCRFSFSFFHQNEPSYKFSLPPCSVCNTFLQLCAAYNYIIQLKSWQCKRAARVGKCQWTIQLKVTHTLISEWTRENGIFAYHIPVTQLANLSPDQECIYFLGPETRPFAATYFPRIQYTHLFYE